MQGNFTPLNKSSGFYLVISLLGYSCEPNNSCRDDPMPTDGSDGIASVLASRSSHAAR